MDSVKLKNRINVTLGQLIQVMLMIDVAQQFSSVEFLHFIFVLCVLTKQDNLTAFKFRQQLFICIICIAQCLA